MRKKKGLRNLENGNFCEAQALLGVRGIDERRDAIQHSYSTSTLRRY